ncbi:MAG TPA: DUF5655 domain-containing protein [Pyrinomonadaceae bacterium]|nr:DUF5655 domain-containing protein [Pyrinomonadaceae bacterium]
MATKTSGEIEKEFIAGLEQATGKELSVWVNEIKSFENQKRNNIINLLKTEFAFGHMHASLLTGIYANGGKPVYGDTSELLENQLSKANGMRQLFEAFINFVQIVFPESTVLPKKTYISILEKREFAAINIKPKELKIGFDLGDKPFDEILTKSKLTGPMPRISHQIILTEEVQINEFLAELLKDSYSRSHTK